MRKIIIAVASVVLLLAPGAHTALAHGGGFGGGGFGGGGFHGFGGPHFGHFGFNGFGRRFGFRGQSFNAGGVSVFPTYVPQAPYQPPVVCQETVTVPAESGGVRQITITRCSQ